MPAKRHATKPSRRPDPNAKRSGFGAKLREYLHLNKKAYEDEDKRIGPHNSRQFAKAICERGAALNPKVSVTDAAVGWWFHSNGLPEAKYIAIIERLMGAPWSYLHNPDTPWPRPPTADAFDDLLSLLAPEERAIYYEALRKHIADRLASRRG